ncbi:hypothetical protein NC653_000181 [Populus alba x Populus x berolinensis]|uniref:Translation elongation factor P/YeiP central domain-containing protein n=1 Tax=Populus alba x Populus x berolinensis TaxID=444605 RepID=A0AAD6RIQ0_9ROSI|nr:hypothetical protein NC653_000181 [Populus alba x Populus x berolinensis]
MRALLQLSKRLSRALVFSSSPYSSLTSSRTFSTLTLFSPDCHGVAITTNGNVYARPWFAIQHRGVKVNAIHLRPGNVIEKSGRIFEVVDAEHKQRGRGGAILTVLLFFFLSILNPNYHKFFHCLIMCEVTLELRDVDSGNKQTLRFGAEEAVERVFVEERSFTCLYTEHESVYLIDLEKFEQLEVPLILFGQAAAYLKEEMKVKMQLFDGRPLSGSIPKQVTCVIKETQDHAATPRFATQLARYSFVCSHKFLSCA